ncbi:MAG TPA: M28 family peptidase [Nitriliruptoraceae bacterium]|nr:M28 family peptidase [Nitriliruptoraceae bacterium]
MTHLTPHTTRGRIRVLVIAIAGLLAAALVAAAPAQAKPGNACDKQNNNTLQKLLACMTVDGVREHQAALQAIADASTDPDYPDSRAAGTEGYAGSVDYVVDTLEAAGWDVSLDPVDITYSSPSLLRQLTPVDATYPTGAFTGSGSGDVTGAVIPVDINLDGDRASDSGCTADDYDPSLFTGDNDIALVQRGTCNFGEKAYWAELAGAEAVIIFNQGNTPAREGLIVANGSSRDDGSPVFHGIPVVGASFDQGVALSQADATARVRVLIETRTDYNVIAELPGENDDNVVMAGAHLDSVLAGPGINDNGSGSAVLLELAQLIRKLEPVNTIRLGWWAAEEQGLVGSTSYVNKQPQEELDRIAAYLNFDMVGSPNYFIGVYDADESSFVAGAPVPDGSAAIEDLFEQYFTFAGVPYDDSAFSGRSDYQAFINNGIPSSGLFTGAEVIKTPEQAAIWGGTAGDQFDPCYHLACDTYDNNSNAALAANSGAVAHAVLTLSYSTEAVNGVPGEAVPGSNPLRLPTEFAGPEHTFAGPLGGEGPHDHDHDGEEG